MEQDSIVRNGKKITEVDQRLKQCEMALRLPDGNVNDGQLQHTFSPGHGSARPKSQLDENNYGSLPVLNHL